MTDKELRKLTRTELLELLLIQSREIDRLNEELNQLRERIQQREIAIANSGSIAEAALVLNGVFEAAQAAADQYLENIKHPISDTQTQCAQMLENTQQQCTQMLDSTKERVCEVWEVIRREMYNPQLDYSQWQKIAEYIDRQLKPE